MGCGFTSLRRLAPKFNNSVELSIDLSDDGELCGRVTIEAILRQAAVEEIADTIPEHLITVTNCSLSIKRIFTKDIIGGDSGMLRGGLQVCVTVKIM